MQRIPVLSTDLRSIGYDQSSETLEVEFRNESVYQYSSVPSNIYSALMAAESKGRYFNSEIRKRFRCMKIS